MIIEIKISNYRSINAEQTFSFVAEKAPRHPHNLIPCPRFNLLKVTALFGANASGKSNLVKAIAGMSQFVRDSATRMNDGDLISISQPFRLDSASFNKPSRFEVTVLLEGTLYTYGFAITADRVQDEWLTVQQEKARSETHWFTRRFNPGTDRYEYKFLGQMRPLRELLSARTRSNALLLSTGARENVAELLPLYRYFRDAIAVLDMSGEVSSTMITTTQFCQQSPSLLHKVKNLLWGADINISDLRIENEPITRHPIFSTDLGGEEFQSAQRHLHQIASGISSPHITALRQGIDGNSVEFDFENEESVGTQRLFALAGAFLIALDTGAFLAIDELDCSMHPLLTRRLLELFQSQEANTKGAQLLFTTHDPALFDQELFRRDQIWLAEKRNGASEFYSLADVNPAPRNTEAFLRNYLAGRYGGTPQIGLPLDFGLKQAAK